MRTKGFKGLLLGLLALMMPMVVLLSSTLYFALEPQLFIDFFEENRLAAAVGTDEGGMGTVARALTGYMGGELESLDITVQIDGEPTRYFNDKELAHMVDVRNLMGLGRTVRNVLLPLCLGALALLWRLEGPRGFWQGFLAAVAGAALYGAFLGFLTVTDFEGAFYRFHELFFTNELWLLDPEKDRLIRMLPEHFFYGITVRILTGAGILMGILTAAGLWGVRRVSRKER